MYHIVTINKRFPSGLSGWRKENHENKQIRTLQAENAKADDPGNKEEKKHHEKREVIMLNDIIKKHKKDNPHILEPSRGGCRFCGQITSIEVPDDWNGEMKDELATEICNCYEAKEYTFKKHRKEKAIKAIKEQFGEKSKHSVEDEVRLFLEMAADIVVEGFVNSATIDLGNGVKAKIGATSKGNIKVEKTITEKTTKEA